MRARGSFTHCVRKFSGREERLLGTNVRARMRIINGPATKTDIGWELIMLVGSCRTRRLIW